MAIRPDNFEYRFEPAAISQIRESLGLTQSSLAASLGVPINTLSRWERGASTPDGNALAALYSIATRSGVTPEFFRQAEPHSAVKANRTRLVFIWDLSEGYYDPRQLQTEWRFMEKYLSLVQPQSRNDRALIAFVGPENQDAVQALRESDFEIRVNQFGHQAYIVGEARHLAATDPSRTILVLATRSGDFGPLLKEIRRSGAVVYFWDLGSSETSTAGVVDRDNLIHRNAPFVVTKGFELIEDLGGAALTRDDFNRQLRDRLEPSDIYPSDAGFTEKNPYGNVIDWFVRKGVIEVSESETSKDEISLNLLDLETNAKKSVQV